MTPKPVRGAHLVLATATFLKSLMGRNIKISKQKMHALLHFSHSTGDKLQFPEIRHDTAVKICQMECRPRSALVCPVQPSGARWSLLQSHLRDSCFWSRWNNRNWRYSLTGNNQIMDKTYETTVERHLTPGSKARCS